MEEFFGALIFKEVKTQNDFKMVYQIRSNALGGRDIYLPIKDDYDESELSTSFIVYKKKLPIGTVRLVFDSPAFLPLEKRGAFIHSFRKDQTRKLTEAGRYAFDIHYRATRNDHLTTHEYLIRYAKLKGYDDLFVIIKPQRVKFYQKMNFQLVTKIPIQYQNFPPRHLIHLALR